MNTLEERERIKWRWGFAVALVMVLLAIYPQLNFLRVRGDHWNGSYAAIEGVGDEVAYSAYVNALIDGRPRRNDPYSGRDHDRANPQSESLFSIQFVPAYIIAGVARMFGISAATTFIILAPITAGLVSLTLFWLLVMITRDEGLSATGTLVVLCLGTVVGGHGLFAGFYGVEPLYNYLMFLRRYQPAASFPLFILYFALFWRLIAARTWRAQAIYAVAVGTVFGLLVFSYVYLWTAVLAWMGVIVLLWAVARPDGWEKNLKAIGIAAALSIASLIPLAVLYSSRASSLDSVQAMESSHRPDLFRLPELVSFLLIVTLAFLIKRKSVAFQAPHTLFALAFSLMPLVVFNQQIITGKSLQPLHYEMFVANYSALISLVLVLAMIVRRRTGVPIVRRKAVLLIGLAALEWGAYETHIATQRSMEFAGRFDEARPLAMRLERGIESGSRPALILSSDLLAADALPTSTANGVLWAPHMMVFSGVGTAESKERFYQYLYFTGITPDRLREILLNEHEYGFTAGLFGFERTMKGLSLNPKPITRQELEDELRLYTDYCNTFTSNRVRETEISYFMIPINEQRNLSNLDRWYQRDAGEQVGGFMLYRLHPRVASPSISASYSETDAGRKTDDAR